MAAPQYPTSGHWGIGAGETERAAGYVRKRRHRVRRSNVDLLGDLDRVIDHDAAIPTMLSIFEWTTRSTGIRTTGADVAARIDFGDLLARSPLQLNVKGKILQGCFRLASGARLECELPRL